MPSTAGDRGLPADLDVAFLTAQIDAPERAVGSDLENVDRRRLLGLVRRQGRIGSRLDLENVERLSRG